MSELCVERSIEPAQDEALSHLVGIGVGRAITVMGDLLGTRLAAAPPVVRFVSTDDHARPGNDDASLARRAVRSSLTGSLVAHAITWMPPTTVSYFVSRIGTEEGWGNETSVQHAVAAHELGSIVLSSVLEGMRGILPDRGRYTHPELVSEASQWWQSVQRSSVGGLSAWIEIEDASTALEFEFCLLTGPRGLDLLLGAVENLLAVA